MNCSERVGESDFHEWEDDCPVCGGASTAPAHVQALAARYEAAHNELHKMRMEAGARSLFASSRAEVETVTALQMARTAMIDNGLTPHALPRVFEIIDAALLAAQPAADAPSGADPHDHIATWLHSPDAEAEPARADRRQFFADVKGWTDDDWREVFACFPEIEARFRAVLLPADRQGVALSDEEIAAIFAKHTHGLPTTDRQRTVAIEIGRVILSRASSSRAEVEIPASVKDWHAAWQAHVEATAAYNARWEVSRKAELGAISLQDEYVAMTLAKNKVLRMLPTLFEGIGTVLAAAEAPNGEGS